MDLEGFDAPFDTLVLDWKDLTDAKAWSIVDSWFFKASRSARWMDLLGDYAGSEPFVIDGEGLLQIVLDDPLLAIGRDGCSFQILHAYHILESMLEQFQRRRANFQIIFWDDTKHATIQTGSPRFAMASRLLARSMLFNHLATLPFRTHVFESVDDPLWVEYNVINKPMFVMMNDGNSGGATKSPAAFYQRTFMLSLLTRGMSVALLRGAEYRESKILSFVYEPLRGAANVLTTLTPAIKYTHNMLETYFKSDCYRLKTGTTPASFENDEQIANLFRALNIPSSTNRKTPPEISFLFLVHVLLVPSLTVQQRAQKRRPLHQTLEIVLEQFLSPLFIKMAKILACKKFIIELDGIVLSALLHLILSRPTKVEAILGHTLHRRAESIWKSLGGPVLNFGSLSSNYPSPKDSVAPSQISKIAKTPIALLPFNNPVFNEEFTIFGSLTSKTDLVVNSPNEGVKWSDDRHWHNQKTILPSHLGGAKEAPSDPRAVRRRLRSDQRFMAVLQTQAATLTGAAGTILRQIVITPVGKNKPAVAERNSSTWNKKQVKKEPTLTSSEKLRLQIKQEKLVTVSVSAEAKWSDHLSKMSKELLSTRLYSIDALLRNANLNGTPYVLVEMRLYRIQLQLELWISDNNRTSSDVRDKYTLSLMKSFQEICRDGVITSSAKKALTSMLIVLGFREYVDCLSALEMIEHASSFTFIKLISSKTEAVRSGYEFMAITEHPTVWQLRLFGDYMDRSMDSRPDKRVSFEPDAWQRRVLDGIDQNKSLLVVAPTSAGKTFISFYAMEKVLRESDDGILVYIAPTKALVTQIAAEVYARFRKDLNGRSCWAIHTRDFRIHNPQECQILVTVPEMLAIMLLTPLTAKNWTPRIKRIVLDEIHSIGQQEGGAVWEQILLLAPCPIIGLSATIGSPEIFSNWLASVQKAHGFDYDFIEHHTRYSHLRKFFYLIDGKGTFGSIGEHCPTKRMRFMHPITMLLFGAQKIPSDLSLEAGDTLRLYYALCSVQKDIPHDLRPLEPRNFFNYSSSLLRQKDVLDYESKLKDIVADLLSSFDPRKMGSPLGRVIQYLQKQDVWTDSEADAQEKISAFGFQNDLLTLLCDLHALDNLPAILFSFDREHCDIMARHISKQLEGAETRWRSKSPEWLRKMNEWEAWKKASAARKRALAKATKHNRKQRQDEYEMRDSPDATWHSSFDPKRPSAQFSFVGQCVDYSVLQLDEDIRALAWAPIPNWAFAALRRGIAVHHAGMNKQYRSLIESLFRKGFIRVIIATGTLALGINAPAKTSVFVNDSPFLTALMYRQCAGRAGRRGFDLRGNVVFYGLPLDRVRRLVLSRLPTLGGNFPLTATMTLRLFNMLHGSGNATVAVRAIKSIITLPQITVNSDFGQDQLLHHVRFSIEYLRRSSLLDGEGGPIGLSAIAAHLYYTEPSNLAFVALYKSGALHDICNQDDIQSAKKAFMLVMCNLFGRQYLPNIFAKEDNLKNLTTKYPSMIILPRLPSTIQEVLVAHDKEILDIFQCYALAYAEYVTSVDNTLPLSRLRVGPRSDDAQSSLIHEHLQETSIVTKVRSPFVANSGHGDTFDSVTDLTRTTRAGLNLTHQAIPTMSKFISGTQDSDTLNHRLNAYILDFYIHGQVKTLSEANCIRRGEVWYLLEEFMLTLKTVRAALIQMVLNTPLGEEDLTLPGSDVESDDQEEASWDAESTDAQDDASDSSTYVEPSKELHDKPMTDSKLLLVVSEVCEEFTVKFKAMWA